MDLNELDELDLDTDLMNDCNADAELDYLIDKVEMCIEQYRIAEAEAVEMVATGEYDKNERDLDLQEQDYLEGLLP